MEIREFKVPKRKICGICHADLGPSEKEEGELGYDGCEDIDEFWEYTHR